ncbi:MAG TPA: phosphoribosylaminoimidazolesuccinocarboxamide synthase [Candidatus Dormibacteraeota bacterium]|nr:phosphoribosylaminoimidazolesuccinocarboxamide synthase [Candidatus Dormibacteraeota bacterium]
MTGPPPALERCEIPGLPLRHRGKVRDTFDLGDRLLMVATDRISAFDCILPTAIPDKGRVLTAMSRFWFQRTAGTCANHLLADDPAALPAGEYQRLQGRLMFVRRAERIDVECVVRRHLAGSGWAEYLEHGTLAGEPLPAGLREGDPLPTPRFTPATKSEVGHDENISRAQLADLVGGARAAALEERSLALAAAAVPQCEAAGFILADTKFEFGLVDGRLTLIDECLTPDSSRFWERSGYAPGGPQPGFDKQLVRDHLLAGGWDRLPPAPALSPALVTAVRTRYLEACRRITGIDLSPTSSSP